MKSLKAGSNITLKKGISCPDSGEGLRVKRFQTIPEDLEEENE